MAGGEKIQSPVVVVSLLFIPPSAEEDFVIDLEQRKKQLRGAFPIAPTRSLCDTMEFIVGRCFDVTSKYIPTKNRLLGKRERESCHQ